ncbi:MAG: ATP-dependent DNA helicase [Polaromonas sp.]|uniref:ATP-dependent DNA helicase n=1 Tax=Polaromonas sp. TaxID=1869339 RepID=UPI0025FA9333|nr:ATP-dependent DNA helicase [Polaromonas sp.]MBI2726412.1 ATP-dependent DNA helicase [Polaromonas sp.]
MTYLVAVRALCEFTAKHGDLDLRFTPAPSAQEGMAGHALVASRRGADYEAEVSLEGGYKTLRVRGRADGYDPVNNLLEEVKTFRGDLHNIADNRRDLHWAQAKIYGWLLCMDRGLQDINISLVYFDVASMQETPLTELFTAAALKEYFEMLCEGFLVWATQEMAHRLARDEALLALKFPHPTFRLGQRELAEAVYKTASAGKCLMAQATTGIGKTIATVFPLLKAAPKQQLDKIFFLAAKTPGRRLALDAFERIADSRAGLPLRILELVARDKACEHPDKACHGDACPLAKGFYDRLPAARSAAVARANGLALDKAALRGIALTHQVCPYYLSQDLVAWSDVVIGDYNYYFDSSALLHGMMIGNQWRVAALVDEAHNMVERTRKMYSARLDQAQLHAVHASAPRAVRPTLDRLNRSFNDLHKMQMVAWQVHKELPVEFLKALQQAISTITDFLTANPTRVDADLQAFYFEALHFARMAETFAAHSMFDITLGDDSHSGAGGDAETAWALPDCAVLNIRNIVPAPFLAPRFAAARSVALFSATLSPQDFYRDTLGLPDTTAWIDVQSPFSHEQLRVSAVSNISTRYQHRDNSLTRIADLMARQYHATPGNYLAFLSSYDYLQKLKTVFVQRHPDIMVWEQTRQMDEAGREEFLQRFTPSSEGIGFAVLGGAFAEGVDLPGRRLIGAFIATLGLPQVNAVNEEIRKRMGDWFEADSSGGETAGTGSTPSRGYNYTYLYPGIQKVVQAAGRVIRTQLDEGVIYLMDDRFTQPEVQALLPLWWKVGRLHAPAPTPAAAPAPTPAAAPAPGPRP